MTSVTHFLSVDTEQGADRRRLHVETDSQYPGRVFLHFSAAGFSLCHVLDFRQSAVVGEALCKASELASPDRAEYDGDTVAA